MIFITLHKDTHTEPLEIIQSEILFPKQKRVRGLVEISLSSATCLAIRIIINFGY